MLRDKMVSHGYELCRSLFAQLNSAKIHELSVLLFGVMIPLEDDDKYCMIFAWLRRATLYFIASS